jgi:hypothetical protein
MVCHLNTIKKIGSNSTIIDSESIAPTVNNCIVPGGKGQWPIQFDGRTYALPSLSPAKASSAVEKQPKERTFYCPGKDFDKSKTSFDPQLMSTAL